jgi:uncharacterized protein YfdQ (DUF2303 family)
MDLQPLIAALQQSAWSDATLEELADAPGVSYVIGAGGRPVVLDMSDLLEQPTEKRGRFTFDRPESFGRYVDRHAGPGTEVFVQRRAGTAVAIIDGHADDLPGHGRHVAELKLAHSAAWQRIMRAHHSGTMAQADFADWVDDVRDEVTSMQADQLLELIDNLHVTSSANQREVRSSGHNRQITYSEETIVKGGKSSVELPSKLELRSTVFDGLNVAYPVMVRLSVVAKPGEPTRFRFGIPRLVDIVEAATDAAIQVAEKELGEVPVFAGQAEHGGSVSPRIIG